MASLIGFVRDIFDANTEEDRRKRRERGEAEWYADQQRASGNRRPAQNIGGAFLGSAARGLNTLRGLPEEAYNTARVASALLTNNDSALKRANQAVLDFERKQYNPNSGLFGAGTIYDSPEQKRDSSYLESIKRGGATSIGAIGEAAPIPALRAVKGANLLTRTGKVGALSSVANIAADTGEQILTTGKIDPRRTALAAGTGFALGAGAPLALAGSKRAARFAKDNPLDEAGSISIPKKSVNDIPKLDDASFRLAQDTREQLYKQKLPSKSKNTVGRSIYDPRNIEQKLDNAEFKRLKKAGLIKKGQKELLPEQSLTAQRGRIQNPYRAAEIRNKKVYEINGNKWSINKIIKQYGKENSKKARDFENYRIYRDELERLNKGYNQTIDIDPQAMAKYVDDYEKINPLAPEHNAVLRQSSLEGLAEKRKMRIDNPELFDIAKGFQNFNPRKAVDPEDLLRPKMTGGVRSGAKKTLGRSETAGGSVRSPLSIFRERNIELERALAEQRYGFELRKRTKAGNIKGATEVVDAEKVIVRKQLLQEARKISEEIKSKSIKASNKRSDLRSANIFKGGAEYQAAKKAKDLLRQSVKDPDARSAINDMSRKDLVDVFKLIAESGEKNVERLRSNLAKRTNINKKLLNEVDSLKAQIAIDRENAQALRSGASEFTENLQRGTQTYNYKLDGEIGKLEIPADLAESLSKQNELMNRSLVERGLQVPAAAQKLTWTGVLQPAFKVWNVAVKNPLLMFRNADGFSGIRPEAGASIFRQILNTKKMSQFKKNMLSRNMAYENALQTRNVQSIAADDIAARANLKTFFARNPLRTMGDLWRGLSAGLASVDNAQRYSVAYGAYKRAKGLGFTEKQALDIAAEAPGKVLGDFDRVTRLAQNLETIIPYSGATQAGTRALFRASRTKPVQTAFKDAALLGSMGGLTAYSMGNASEYYEDMINNGKRYVLDNNWTIAWPWAKKNADGSWSGITHIPLTPDFRPANRAVWQTIHGLANSKGVNPKMLAGELFNQMTGDSGNNLYADEKTNNRKNLVNGVLPSSPVVNLGKTVFGVNSFTGEPLADEYLATRPRTEQATEYTNQGAKTASKALGGLFTPQQIDQLFSQTGTFGDILQRKEGESLATTFGKSFTSPLQSGKVSKTSLEGKKYYENLDKISRTIKDPDDFRAFQKLHAKNPQPGILDSAEKAETYLARPAVLEADRKLDALARKQGKPGNPMFDLSNEQLDKVLKYRQAKMLNAGKQTYDENGNPLFTSLDLDAKWYDKFRDKETNFYDQVKKDRVASLKSQINNATTDTQKMALRKELNEAKKDEDFKTFSGAPKPDNPKLEKLQNQYFALSKDQRSGFLRVHPELLTYWEAGDGFTNKERLAIGLKKLEDGSGGTGGFGRYGRSGGSSTGGGGFLTKTASSAKISTPSGVRVKKLSPPKATPQKKISVSKIKSNYLNRKLG